jgi:hypothetical protein
MKHRLLAELVGVVSLLVLISSPAWAEVKEAGLEGFQEVPALSTTGEGTCILDINQAGTEIEATVDYSDLVGDVTQAHIHFGQLSVNGGIALFLCTNAGNGPTGTPTCPAAPATVTRTLSAADVVGPEAQGIAAGELEEVIAAIRAGKAYCNVHSTVYPAGEIRGQLKSPSSR